MESISKTFGGFFKFRRKSLGLTLRKFCQMHNLEPSNMSKLERGLLPPPQKREKLEEYARMLKLEKGSDDWYQFFDLAYAERGKIPEEVLDDTELLKKLPVLFRTLRGQKVSDEQLNDLIERIRRA